MKAHPPHDPPAPATPPGPGPGRRDGTGARGSVLILNWRDTTHPEGGGSEVYVERVAAGPAAPGRRGGRRHPGRPPGRAPHRLPACLVGPPDRAPRRPRGGGRRPERPAVPVRPVVPAAPG